MSKPLVVITGASSGLGMAMITLFSAAGFSLGLLAHSKIDHSALTDVLSFVCDITDPAAVEKAIMQAEARFGPVDCLINNSGYGKEGEFTSHHHTVHENTININLMGALNAIEVVLPGMQARKAGTLINISSLADRGARPQLATYAASKAAVKSLSASLRMANAKLGIRVCNIAPARVRTDEAIRTALSATHLIDVADMAKTVLWVYQQPKNICIRDLVVAPTYYEL